MADYQILAVGLTTPPTPAYLTAYRPAVAVQNLGTQPVTLAGSFRVYERVAPGRLLFSCNLSLASLPAGTTRDALGDAFWTPPAIGSYTVQAHITTNRPGVFSDFGPYLLPVSGSPPPPPPVVTAHAPQHEGGGSDELRVDGLLGELADDQPPKDHAGKHEQGGADELSVTGLHGTLADAQPTEPHWNDKHTVAGASLVDLGAHTSAPTAHAAATNLEKTADKNQPGGYAGLDTNALVPAARLGTGADPAKFLRGDQSWQDGVAPPYAAPGPTTPGILSSEGSSQDATRADHGHQSPGGIACRTTQVLCPAGTTQILDASIPPNASSIGSVFRVSGFAMLTTETTGTPAASIDVPNPEGGHFGRIIFGSLPPGLTNVLLHFDFLLTIRASGIVGQGIGVIPSLGLFGFENDLNGGAWNPANPNAVTLYALCFSCSLLVTQAQIEHVALSPATT